MRAMSVWRQVGRGSGLFFAAIAAAAMVAAATAAPPSPTFVASPTPTYVGDTVTGAGCGYQPFHWYEIDTYGPNSATDGPLDSVNVGRAGDAGCIAGTLLAPASEAGTYSAYVVPCGSKGSGSGCSYGSHTKVVVDVDFEVLSSP